MDSSHSSSFSSWSIFNPPKVYFYIKYEDTDSMMIETLLSHLATRSSHSLNLSFVIVKGKKTLSSRNRIASSPFKRDRVNDLLSTQTLFSTKTITNSTECTYFEKCNEHSTPFCLRCCACFVCKQQKSLEKRKQLKMYLKMGEKKIQKCRKHQQQLSTMLYKKSLNKTSNYKFR